MNIKKILTAVFAAAFCVCAMSFAALAVEDWDADEITISTADELREFAEKVNNGKTFEGISITLADNISLGDEEWTPIGSKEEEIYFKGTFDGAGKTISGLKITSGDYIALFGATENAVVKNLTVSGSVTGSNAAGIIARMHGGTVSDCVNDVEVTVTEKKGAGIVCMTGVTYPTIIEECVNNGAINGENANDGVAGIIGYISNSGAVQITDCTNTADITAGYHGAGIAGYGMKNGTFTISGATNTGNVEATQDASGIMGYFSGSTAKIINCTNSGSITSGGKAGGIAAIIIDSCVLAGNTNTGDIEGDTDSSDSSRKPCIAMIEDEYFETISDAVEAAENGDTIIISEGEFDIAATITIDKPLTIKGAGKGNTSLLFNANTSVFTIASSEVTIQDMSISNESTESVAYHISVSKGAWDAPAVQYSDITLKNLELLDSKYSLCLIGENIVVDGCEFTNQDSHSIIVYSLRGNSYITSNIFNAAIGTNKHAILFEGGVSTTLTEEQHKAFDASGTLTIEGNEAYDKGCFMLFTNWGFANSLSLEITDNYIDAFTNKAVAFDNTNCTVSGKEFASINVNDNVFTNLPDGKPVVRDYTNSLTINADDNYWGSENPDFETVLVGEAIEISSYYTDEEKTETAVPTIIAGKGTEESPYLIGTADELFLFAKNVNAGKYANTAIYVQLTDNIDLEQEDWTSIGTADYPFGGTFDGNGKTISNLWCAEGENGLFGYVASGNRSDNWGTEATIQNLTINGAVVNDSAMKHNGAAAVVGCGNMYTTIKNVNVIGQILITGSRAGGILGYEYSGTIIDNCHVDGANEYGNSEINAVFWACGGIQGFSANESVTEITNCSVKNVNINAVNNYGAAAILGNGSGGKVENVVAENVTITAASYPEYNAYLSGGPAATGDSKVIKVSLTVAGEPVAPEAGITVMVAEINGEYYETLAEAFAAVEDGETIELIADAELEKSVAFTKDIEFTLDGNGFSIVPAEGSTEVNSAFNLGQGDDNTIATRKYTIKNVTFDGWTTDHVLRLQGVDAVVEDCTFINCNQDSGLALLSLTFCDAEVSGCVFKDNICLKVIDINSNSTSTTALTNVISVDDCTFEKNICNVVGAIYYHRGDAFTLTDSKFIENKVNLSANGATVYCGYQNDVTITGCYFEGNEIDTTSETESRVSPTIFVGNACEISGNAFIGNTATRNGEDDGLAQMVVSTYYSDIDLSGNYWGGSAPVAGTDYNRIHSGMGFDIEISDYYTEYDLENGELGGSDELIANIGDQFYGTLQEAVSAAGENAVIELRPVTISEGTIKLPASIQNLTILGTKTENSDVVLAADDEVAQTTIKDTTIMSADGSSINYDGFTVDGIIFDNSNIVMTGWRTSGEIYKNFTITNNVFKNIERTGNNAALHLNMTTAYPLVNLTFENNVIDGVSGSSNSGIYTTSVDGNVVIRNNVINNVALRPFIIQFNNDNGNADTFTVTGNTFSGSAAGRLQALTTNAAGTDAVTINVNGNAIVGITSTQAICFWNFNEETTTVDFSKNFYGDYDPTENFSRFYYNSAAASYADIIDMGILPYYTDVAFDGNGKPVFEPEDLVDGLTEDITVSFDKVEPTVEGELTYNINLVAKTDSIINRLNSGDLTFVLNQVGEVGNNKYEIIDIKGDNIAVNPVDDKGRYEFHFSTKTGTDNDTASVITIAQVKFTGYGTFTFGIDDTKKTNAVHTTTTIDNVVDTYLPEGELESDGSTPEGTLNISKTIAETIAVPTRALSMSIAFPNAVENKEIAYQQMKVVISGGDLAEDLVIDLGSDYAVSDLDVYTDRTEASVAVGFADGAYSIEIEKLLRANVAYNVTVSGAGYRTAYHTVQMTTEKTLSFWNNVKDAEKAIEVYEADGQTVESGKTKVTFLAGDIVHDGNINIYDLSAVVSYFGEEDLAKYDLNRDGKIDSKDVAYVLVSWGN